MMSWIEEEFATINLRDARHFRRVCTTKREFLPWCKNDVERDGRFCNSLGDIRFMKNTMKKISQSLYRDEKANLWVIGWGSGGGSPHLNPSPVIFFNSHIFWEINFSGFGTFLGADNASVF